MLLSWIIKTIPRSPRAVLLLIIMFGSTSMLFSALTELLMPTGGNNAMLILKLLAGFVIGISSTGAFYYVQHTDEVKRHGSNDLEVLNNYMEIERLKHEYTKKPAIPVYNSQTGALDTKIAISKESNSIEKQ